MSDTQNVAPFNVKRDVGGRFLTGQGGRPVGTKNKISRDALAAVRSMKDDAIKQLGQLVANGDLKAIVFVLDRILPQGRTVELDDVHPSTVADMLQTGELTPHEVRDIASAVRDLRELEDLEQIRAKLIELEAIVIDGPKR